GSGSGSAGPAAPVHTADDGDPHAPVPVNLLAAEPVAAPEAEVLVPTPQEFVEVLRGEGWEVGDGEYRGEFTFSNDWASFQTMSGPRLVRFAGHVDPARWDELEAMFARTGWNVGIDFHGEDGEVSREILARGSVRDTVRGNLHASGGD
ncbi:hypothetical protein KDA82_36320, partial [Streptomyces daliensis]|nr:hypothetical protein [Streptomyces daliensis]